MLAGAGQIIHRHTGGLEISALSVFLQMGIHRHTGGLENIISTRFDFFGIHRHTGGLENVRRA